MTMLKRVAASLSIVAVLAVASFVLQAQTAKPPATPPKAASQAPAAASPQGPRPEQFKFSPLAFKPPRPADFRTTLSNGLVVYLAEDRQIPWFEATLLTPVAGGGGGGGRGRGVDDMYERPQGPPGGGGGARSFLEPRDKLGIQNLTASVMRSGGTTSMTAEQINERMEYLAGTVSPTSLSIHMRHIDEGLKIWLDVLTNPAFPEDRIRREREAMIMPLRNRNRNITTVATRTFQNLIYGEGSPITAEPTEATISSITRDDVIAWHSRYWGANNAILVVAGDFTKADMLRKLDATFGRWRSADTKATPSYPKVTSVAARSGVYMVQPEGTTPNQGIVRVGFLAVMQDDPDYAAVDLMNYTLGGGSFSSRITQVVRTDQGLAYTANSRLEAEPHYPGTIAAFVQTKNSTVVFATQLMINEIERMRAGDISERDVQFAKTARLRAFPSLFSTVFSNIRNFAQLELDGRPMAYYDTYVARYEKVTLADVKRVAQKYLQTDRMLIVVTGNIEECRAGADTLLPNQGTIDAMAAKFGGRSIDGLAKKYGDGTVNVVKLK